MVVVGRTSGERRGKRHRNYASVNFAVGLTSRFCPSDLNQSTGEGDE
jgi:hypothetical protein